MKVSFDFDGTLSEEHVQQYAKELIERGVDVWVITSRYDENHKHKFPSNPRLDDLWEVVDKLGIPRWKVRFTNMAFKGEYLYATNFLWHLDDNPGELSKADSVGCDVPMILVTTDDWKHKCETFFNELH